MSQLDDEVTVVVTNKPDSELYAVFEESNFDVNVGESAKIDVGTAINYIQSGQAEIAEKVGDIIGEFNDNAVEKTNAFNQNAEDKTGAFDLNATNKTNDFNTNAINKTTAFDNNATSKTGVFDDNAVDKTNAFNSNATDKTTDFNNNYIEKKALIDAEVQTAEAYSNEAKQWAIGNPTEPDGNSAKYWAEASASAAATVGNGTITLTQGGVTKGTFTTNQSGNATIDVDAATIPSNMVTTDTQQNINAIKTFKGVDMRFMRGGSDLKTQATSNENWVGPRFVDNNDVQGALVQYRRLSTGVAETNIQTRALSTNGFSKIAIYQNPDGTAYTEAPTPTQDTNNSTQIDTVGARNTKLQNYALSSSLATVATSGSYNDLTDKPTIPTKTSDITNDSGYITGISSSDVTTALGYTPANDSNVVKTSGNQSIAGEKTFTGYIKGQAGNDTNHAIKLGSTGVNYMDFYEYGGIWNFYKSKSGTNTLIGKIAELTNSTNDETLATTNWVNSKGYALDSAVVKTSGNQTIGGGKTLTDNLNIQKGAPNIYLKDTSITKGTTPSSTHYSFYGTIYDSQGINQANKMSQIYTQYNTNGSHTLNMSVFKPESGSTTSSALVIGYDSNGNVYTSAPTPDSSDNSTKIATTAFVNSRITTGISGYDATKTQTLKNVNGTLTWVND